MHSARICCFTALLIELFLSGCSGSGAGKRSNVCKVTGKVTMNGAPVASANVSFVPKDKQPAAFARTNADGTFSLTTIDPNDGAAPGDYVVLVSKNVVVAQPIPSHEAFIAGRGAGAPQHDAAGAPPVTSALPEKYSLAEASDLKATVSDKGPNEFTFELKP
jgi:hypothetical protein